VPLPQKVPSRLLPFAKCGVSSKCGASTKCGASSKCGSPANILYCNMFEGVMDRMLASLPYNRERAISYARRWALDRNPLFFDFTGRGGDCTDFVSQCILAGCCVMNYTPDFGWYYISVEDRAPAWTGVEFFYDFITGASDFAAENGGTGPYGYEVPRRGMNGVPAVVPGDVVQLADAEGDFYHTLFITDVEGSEIFVAAHSDDALDRRLSTYNYASSRFIHIVGARIEVAGGDCFEALIAGEALPAPPEMR